MAQLGPACFCAFGPCVPETRRAFCSPSRAPFIASIYAPSSLPCRTKIKEAGNSQRAIPAYSRTQLVHLNLITSTNQHAVSSSKPSASPSSSTTCTPSTPPPSLSSALYTPSSSSSNGSPRPKTALRDLRTAAAMPRTSPASSPNRSSTTRAPPSPCSMAWATSNPLPKPGRN
jgi:hypothetical protein